MANTTASITDNITSPVASLLANTFLIRSTQVIKLLLTWMDNFYLELQAEAQSSKDETWHLVCSCVRCFLKKLRKVRAPAQAASNSDDIVEWVGIILWTMAQSYQICDECITHRWRDHHVMSGAINFYVFQSMVPVSSFKKVKEVVLVIQRVQSRWFQTYDTLV